MSRNPNPTPPKILWRIKNKLSGVLKFSMSRLIKDLEQGKSKNVLISCDFVVLYQTVST